MSDRVTIMVSDELAEKLHRASKGDDGVRDEFVELALAGDPSSWSALVGAGHEVIGYGAIPPSGPVREGSILKVRCPCCGECRNVFTWRGLTRCGCPSGVRPGPGRYGSGVVQADLDGE